MKHLLMGLLLGCSSLFAQYNPTMRINFGGSSAMVRLQGAYYINSVMAKSSVKSELSTQSSSSLSKMRLGFESLFILNNRGRFSESVSRNAPKFLVVRVNHDGFKSSTLSSASIAKALKCRTSIPFFGQVKGYWSLGLAMRNHGMANNQILENNDKIGGRIAFNVYNKTSALQAELCGFKQKAVVNVVVYKKLSPHILFSTGVEYEQALLGLSALIGTCRLTLSTHLASNKKMQHGLSFTANL